MTAAGSNFLGAVAVLVFQLPLVPSSPACNATRQPGGSVMYEVPEPPASSCELSWEDANRTVIARDAARNEALVQTLTNRSITMRRCYDFLRRDQLCSGVPETIECSVNCTRLLEQSPNTTANTSTYHPDAWTFGPVLAAVIVVAVIVVAVIVVAVIVIVVIQRFYKQRCCRTGERVSYCAAPLERVKMEIQNTMES